MKEQTLKIGRISSVVAATCIALACGTNYAYSAWGPQFADRLKLSATKGELVGNAGNFGMYFFGIPLGFWIDNHGHRPALVAGAICLGAGYFPLKIAYDHGPGSMNIVFLCFFSLLTGLGGCASFMTCIKVCALNWPHKRGTATAFPLAAFGLSAFFFTLLASFAFPDSTSSYLLLLSLGTFLLVTVGSLFLRVYPLQSYRSLPSDDMDADIRASLTLRRSRSGDTKPSSLSSRYAEESTSSVQKVPNTDDSNETASLVSESDSTASLPGDLPPSSASLPPAPALVDAAVPPPEIIIDSHPTDATGIALLYRPDFWRLFVTMGILTGVGLMTINNIGNDARSLWTHYDDSVSKGFIEKRQLAHVSILSCASFSGRLFSGTMSDVVVTRYHGSRFWMVILSGTVFSLGQIAAINIVNPNYLWLVSALNGLGYGCLFGVYPAVVADAFGVSGLSMNWGAMTLAPIFSSNIFNLAYGGIYDRRSFEGENGERTCTDGVECYRGAYWITFFASIVGVGMGLWCMRCDHAAMRRHRLREEEEMHDA